MTTPQVWNQVWTSDDNHEEWNYLSHIILESIAAFLNDQNIFTPGNTFTIVEAGCGSGRISMRLAEQLAAKIVFLDFSSVAVDNLKSRLEKTTLHGHVVQGDLFHIPLHDNSCHVIWNGGVLEHFTGEQQQKAVSEMVRIIKPGGYFITLNPYAGSLLHSLGKAFVERVTTYPYGEEIPIQSLQPQLSPHVASHHIQEYSIGFIALFVGVFKRLMIIPGFSFFKPVYRWVDQSFCTLCRTPRIAARLRRADLLLSRWLGGYLLVTTAQKVTGQQTPT